MELLDDALMLKVYLGESDKVDGKAAYKHITDTLRKEGIWGATVTRGVLGYGRSSTLHASSPLRLSQDLPIVIEAVDRKEKIQSVIPKIAPCLKGGLVVTHPVTAHVVME